MFAYVTNSENPEKYQIEKHWKDSKKRDHFFAMAPACLWKLSRRCIALISRVISSKVSPLKKADTKFIMSRHFLFYRDTRAFNTDDRMQRLNVIECH